MRSSDWQIKKKWLLLGRVPNELTGAIANFWQYCVKLPVCNCRAGKIGKVFGHPLCRQYFFRNADRVIAVDVTERRKIRQVDTEEGGETTIQRATRDLLGKDF